MATIRDLAKLTGISPATISRVLNNNPRVSEENRRRVLEAVEATGYALPKKMDAQPILLAVYGRLTFWEEMYQAIATEAKKLGYTSLSYCVPSAVGKFTMRDFEKDGLLFNENIAGILLSTVEVDIAEYKRLRQRFPVVFCGNPIRLPGGCCVSTDDFRASAEVVNKLLSEGRRRIAILEAQSEAKDVLVIQEERRLGAEWALSQRGLSLQKSWVISKSEELGDVADEIWAMREPLDGIFCMHGSYAMTLTAALRDRGIRLPEDISMASFDLDHFPKVEQRGSWYVRQNFREIGRESVRMLDGIIRHGTGDGKRLYIDSPVSVR